MNKAGISKKQGLDQFRDLEKIFLNCSKPELTQKITTKVEVPFK